MNIKPWEVISLLEETPKRLEKANILSSVEPESEFWLGAFYALDPFTTFGIKALPTPKEYGTGVRWHTFDKLAKALCERQLTGNLAKDTIEAFASSCTEDQWLNWYKRIIKKDLKCGCDISTINKAAPEEYKIKTFDCQLATDINKVKTEHIPTEAFIESKYDGTRTIWIIDNKEPTRCFSRNGKEFLNFGMISRSLECLRDFPGFPDSGIMVDGEVISDDFQTLMKQARRKTNAAFKGTAMVFDMLPLDEFWEQSSDMPLKARRAVLEDMVAFLKDDNTDHPIELSDCIKGVNAVDQMDLVMEKFDRDLESGFEGIMIKDANSTYNFKRDRTWLKMKPTETYDLSVTGIAPGEIGSKYEDTLGALICEGSVDNKLVKVNVGSGLSDELRNEIWNTPNETIGSIVEIKADCLTKSPSHDHWSLRFPRFIRYRDDK